jgi:hypothetical protein
MFGLALENPACMMTYLLHRVCRLQLHLEKATVLTHSMYVTLMVQDSAWHQCTESNGKVRRHARFMLFMQMPQRLHHVGTNNIKQIDCAYTLPNAFTARLFRTLTVKLRSLRSEVVPNKSKLPPVPTTKERAKTMQHVSILRRLMSSSWCEHSSCRSVILSSSLMAAK